MCLHGQVCRGSSLQELTIDQPLGFLLTRHTFSSRHAKLTFPELTLPNSLQTRSPSFEGWGHADPKLRREAAPLGAWPPTRQAVATGRGDRPRLPSCAQEKTQGPGEEVRLKEKNPFQNLKASLIRRTDAFKAWCWRRLLSRLDCKETKPVNPKGNQP